MSSVRILFLADTHLGFDLPVKPRIYRRRRGIDFFKNYELALQPAFSKEVDMVIHGGDLFYRSKIPELLITMAFEPLIRIAESGIPVVLVAGNHERSFIQQSIFEKHENIYVFNQLKSFCFNIKNIDVQVSGFPCVRKNVRSEFPNMMNQIDFKYKNTSHIHLLCIHQAIEGAQVGVQNYTFRTNQDTICAVDIPADFAAVLSGHIHRGQLLTHGLDEQKMKTKVYYPGSIERTSFAEKNETKGYMIFDFIPSKSGGDIIKYEFIKLPSRPMEEISIVANGSTKSELINQIINSVSKIDQNSILRLKIINNKKQNEFEVPYIEEIRNVLPPSINISYKVE